MAIAKKFVLRVSLCMLSCLQFSDSTSASPPASKQTSKHARETNTQASNVEHENDFGFYSREGVLRYVCMYVCRRTNHMDCCMDGFWTWLDLTGSRPGDSRPAWPSTFFPTPFDMDFPMHFGMDLALILEQFWNISVSFWHLQFHHRFCTVFHRISMDSLDP